MLKFFFSILALFAKGNQTREETQITWTIVDQDLQHHMASLGPNELNHSKLTYSAQLNKLCFSWTTKYHHQFLNDAWLIQFSYEQVIIWGQFHQYIPCEIRVWGDVSDYFTSYNVLWV